VRVASRVVGVVLVLAGLVFLGLSVFIVAGGFDRRSVLAEYGPDRTAWVAGSFTVALCIFFLLAGWYYLKLDVDQIDDAPQRASRFAPYFLAHRRELRIIALVGLAVSLIRLVAVYFGYSRSAWPLVLAWFCLLIIGRQIAKPGTMDLNWQTVPERARKVLGTMVKAGGVAFLILGMLFVLNQWSHHQTFSRIIDGGFMVLLFAWESLFFAYGTVRVYPESTTDRPAPPPTRP
jgi:TRAP-type C4-dicarboxylate transport system permease small subunit